MKKTSPKTQNKVTTLTVRDLRPVPVPKHTSQTITIKTDQEFIEAQRLYLETKSTIDAIERDRKEITDPLEQAKKAVIAKAKAAAEPFVTLANALNGAMSNYDTCKRLEAAKMAEKKALAMEKRGDSDAAALTRLEAEDKGAPALDGSTFSHTWKARVTDAALVPAYFNGLELRPIHQPALNKLAALFKDSLKVPGVVAELEKSLRRTPGAKGGE